MTTVIDALNTFFWGYVLFYGLLALGIFFTLRLGFLQFRHFPECFRSVLRAPATDRRAITPIQALCTRLPSALRPGGQTDPRLLRTEP